MDTLPANASHREFVEATDAMNARLAALDLDTPDIEELEDPAPEGEQPEPESVQETPQEPEADAQPEEKQPEKDSLS